MTQRERMMAGMVYIPGDDDLQREQLMVLEKLYDYNMTRPSEQEKRYAMLKDMFADVGEGVYIEPPLHANWAGKRVHLGDWVYANFNLTLVDDEEIFVGDNVLFAPNVVVATAGHPILPELRCPVQCQYNRPVHIGNNVWIGAGAVILPGVTIGDNSVIGAGSVVTKDIPANVVAVGNPCRVLREIGEHDREYFFRGERLDAEIYADVEEMVERMKAQGASAVTNEEK